MKHFNPRDASLIVFGLSLGVILLMIITQTHSLLYDEYNFVPNIHLLIQYGLTNKFLLSMTGSPGPTYAIIHYLCLPFTHFSVQGIRLTNFVLLLLTLYVVYLNAGLLKARDPLMIALNFIAVTMVWVSCGLALTEVPAMLCFVISLYALLQGFIVEHKFITRILLVILAGLFLSFAVLGRTFFLMAILAIPAYVVIRFLLSKFDSGINSETTLFSFNLPSAKQSVIMLIVFLLFSLYLPIKIFMIWHSLAPPQDTGLVGANNLSLVPWYGVLAFCYCGLATLILAPDWFIINKRMLIISTVIAFVFLIINLLQGYFLFAPFMTAAKRFLSLSSFNIYQKTIPAFIFLFAFNFLLSSLVRLWQNRYNPVFMFIALTALLIAFSSIKVKAQFSSRYVGQIVPLFLLLFIPFEKTSWVKVIRISVGVCLGFISLYFYYFGG